MMGVVFDVLFRVVFGTALYRLWPTRRQRVAPQRVGTSLHARRHVVASYRAWLRRGGWTLVMDAWEGTIRGLACTIRPHLEDDAPATIEVSVAVAVGRGPATLRSRRDADLLLPELAPLFLDGTLTRIRWTAKTVDFRFTPLTMPEALVETCEPTLAVLLAPTTPYR